MWKWFKENVNLHRSLKERGEDNKCAQQIFRTVNYKPFRKETGSLCQLRSHESSKQQHQFDYSDLL